MFARVVSVRLHQSVEYCYGRRTQHTRSETIYQLKRLKCSLWCWNESNMLCRRHRRCLDTARHRVVGKVYILCSFGRMPEVRNSREHENHPNSLYSITCCKEHNGSACDRSLEGGKHRIFASREATIICEACQQWLECTMVLCLATACCSPVPVKTVKYTLGRDWLAVGGCDAHNDYTVMIIMRLVVIKWEEFEKDGWLYLYTWSHRKWY